METHHPYFTPDAFRGVAPLLARQALVRRRRRGSSKRGGSGPLRGTPELCVIRPYTHSYCFYDGWGEQEWYEGAKVYSRPDGLSRCTSATCPDDKQLYVIKTLTAEFCISQASSVRA